MKTLVELLNEKQEKANNGPWLPASGGTEEPFFTRTGKKLLYCWQPTTGKHAYLDMGTDIILTDQEANMAIWPYTIEREMR
jgi:hypothetical protein